MKTSKINALAAFLFFTCFCVVLLVQPARAQQGQRVSYQLPVDYRMYMPCRGNDLVQLSGTSNFVFKYTQTHNGDYHLISHNNFQNVTGVNETTGETYRFTGVNNATENVGNKLPFATTVVNTGSALSVGGGVVFRMHVLTRVTVNEQGEMSTEFLRESWVCDTDGEEDPQ